MLRIRFLSLLTAALCLGGVLLPTAAAEVDCDSVYCFSAEDFSADELGFILDTFWIQAGGANPAEYIRRYAGRIPVIHLKDYQFATGEVKNSICAIGDGNINFGAVAAAAADSGVEYMLVEQDTCHGEDPFSAMKRSYDYLKAMGLE